MIYFFLLGSLLGLSGPAFAFPELVTHGYVNCTACHVSPSGGGVLSEYGRGLSRELLSRWGVEGEEGFLEGIVKTPEWLIAGGDVRAIQTYFENSQVRQREFFLMQSDLTLGARLGHWTAVGTFGVVGGPSDAPKVGTFLSRSHYLMNQISEGIEIRGGKFLPQFGINEPNHTVVTRSLLGFGEDRESYNLEAAYLGERFDIFVTGIFGRPDDLSLHREKGVALSASFNFLDKNKIGLSFYRGSDDQVRRMISGLWGVFALAKEIFLLSELDWASVTDQTSQKTQGPILFQRLGWEATKGVQLYGTYQFAKPDLSRDSTQIDAYGPGIDFFPRPHFEFRAEYLKQRQKSESATYADVAWLLAHYYF